MDFLNSDACNIYMILILFISMICFLILSEHYINCILVLEIMSLDIFFYYGYLVSFENIYLLMYFIVLIVCESVFGLSVLVNNFRLYSTFNFSTMSFCLC